MASDPPPHVLVTTNMSFARSTGENPLDEIFAGTGLEVTFGENSPGWPNTETREKLAGIDALLAGGEWITPENLELADRLKLIARNGVGYDRVDLELCSERGIVVTNTPGVMADAVADLAMGLLLACVRGLIRGDKTVKGGRYTSHIGEDLSVMTLGLMGCGRIGAQVVRRALAFGMEVVVCDPWVDAERIAELGARSVSQDELLSSADAISLHLPLTDDNEEIVDEHFLGRMKPGSYIVNTARGKLVDESALIAALLEGRLAGAGLDCQAIEPPEGVSLELSQMDEVVVMPHAGSSTVTARRRMATMAAEQIVTFLQGRVPPCVVNPEVLDKLDLQE